MNRSHPLPLKRQVHSDLVLWLVSLSVAIAVFALAVFLQWLIYDDWLHNSGLRLSGSVLAAVLALIFAYSWQWSARERKKDLLARLEKIRWMNDRIRNALQAIECVTYASAPEATASVHECVDTIDAVLRDVLADTHPETNKGQNLPGDAQCGPGALQHR